MKEEEEETASCSFSMIFARETNWKEIFKVQNYFKYRWKKIILKLNHLLQHVEYISVDFSPPEYENVLHKNR